MALSPCNNLLTIITMYKYAFILLFILPLISFAQNDMTEGFKFLEKGDFQNAEDFFEGILQKEPTNKTARLCYGRAVGLSGEPKRANSLFSELLEEYPGDFEVEINYNESYLWSKDYKSARPLYKKLVSDYPDKFGAVLGFANTLSNLKEYELALEWVDKAIALDPENKSALVSKKYMRLGYANAYINNQQYDKGEEYLQKIFTDFPEDKDALQNLANLYLIIKNVDKAKETYKRYATNAKDSIIALNGIALAEHIGEKNKTALEIALKSKREVLKVRDTPLTEQTYNRYVQALIWNQKYKKAQNQIDSLMVTNPNRNWIMALDATLGMYTANFKKSIKNYDKILANDSNSFDGNLGKANALFASDKIIPAYKAAKQTLVIYKKQKDATNFIEKLDLQFTPNVEEHAAYTFDNGNNTAYSTKTTTQLALSTKFSSTFSYQYRLTENTVTLNKASSHVLIAGLQYKLFPKTNLKTVFGVNKSISTDTSFSQPVLDIRLQLQPMRLQNLDLIYTREVQSFNAELIEREIVMNHYGLTYNLGTTFNLGWYTQAIYTEQTDSNKRNLLFSSLYYNLFKKPAVKIGVNYQYLSFSNQVPSIYFSPSIYQAVEFFADVRAKLSDKSLFMISAASGYQKVEEDPMTVIFRAETGVQHQFSKRLSGKIYGKYSNIASATAAGFQFTEIGFKLKWLFTKKPLFYANLQKKIALN
ncbi:tetratricopeptide repeat protein [uncultured Maribacter sp.]|uniref:tetratricopeptide repeat protein n=1 Tax=uncultured Maribacter sp. TaxID=431308 RepID=UPI0026146E8D|nr:tetratricopeptide repeat protein [uncultured Maribacter sp.]